MPSIPKAHPKSNSVSPIRNARHADQTPVHSIHFYLVSLSAFININKPDLICCNWAIELEDQIAASGLIVWIITLSVFANDKNIFQTRCLREIPICTWSSPRVKYHCNVESTIASCRNFQPSILIRNNGAGGKSWQLEVDVQKTVDTVSIPICSWTIVCIGICRWKLGARLAPLSLKPRILLFMGLEVIFIVSIVVNIIGVIVVVIVSPSFLLFPSWPPLSLLMFFAMFLLMFLLSLLLFPRKSWAEGRFGCWQVRRLHGGLYARSKSALGWNTSWYIRRTGCERMWGDW
mmetsp:Transcript_33194/g.80619  ORF Transcript_33194/g.80619 Transcript_33194/m.80619 type:complete len:290 (-) Transcript_33194:716-1585(-)